MKRSERSLCLIRRAKHDARNPLYPWSSPSLPLSSFHPPLWPLPEKLHNPFPPLEGAKYVGVNGNAAIRDHFGVTKMIKPFPSFVNYVWHMDRLDHLDKLPNVITGFHHLEVPTVGGETDFISGEDVYDSLTADERSALTNMAADISRPKTGGKPKLPDFKHDGAVRAGPYEEDLLEDRDAKIPIVFAPESSMDGGPRVIILPIFLSRIGGWSAEHSQKWLEQFMRDKVLPHRVSMQWRRGDLVVFNNRRFMHASSPFDRYTLFDDAGDWLAEPSRETGTERLFHQMFVPTTIPLRAAAPSGDADAAVRCGWASAVEAEAALAAAAIHAATADGESRKRLKAVGVTPEERAGTFLERAKPVPALAVEECR
ncbi:unnamed protein product [Phaeothamnion confervicola]